MITSVSFAKLYSSSSIQRVNQFENERLEATAAVENGDVAAAWDEARAEVEAENARREAAYQEAEERRREEYQAERARERAEREARRAAYGGTQTTADDGDLAF